MEHQSTRKLGDIRGVLNSANFIFDRKWKAYLDHNINRIPGNFEYHMKTLGCSIALWNGNKHDFCWRECIQSVLPICEQVVVAVIPGDDGTQEALVEMNEPKLKVVEYESKIPKADGLWVMNWTNFAREHLTTDYNLQMDADEVLHQDSHEKLLSKLQGPEVSLLCQRWNFWNDPWHMIPFGHCCAHEVLRVAPTRCWLPADVPLPQGQEAMNLQVDAREIHIFHYGFLRKHEAFFQKERILQTAFTGGYDPLLDPAEKEGRAWTNVIQHPAPLEKFFGTHPKYAHEWLIERGYQL